MSATDLEMQRDGLVADGGDRGTGSRPRKPTEQTQTASIWVLSAPFFWIFMLEVLMIKCWRRKKNKESLAVPLPARHRSSGAVLGHGGNAICFLWSSNLI